MDQQSWTPDRILKLSGGYWETCVLHCAVALDLFTRIGEKRISAWDLARQANKSEDGMERLLDALAAMGLLTKEIRGYANTQVSRNYLCADSDQYLGFIIQHHHHLMESWSRLPESVATGKPIEHPDRITPYKKREAFLMGMFNLAMQLAPRLVPHVDFSDCRTLLDLGGGPGTYAIHFCRQYPGLRATVMDLDTTQPFAEETIQRMGMAKRVTFKAANYIEETITGRFDAVWMSHVLHGESAEDCQRIIQKAADCLNPGGVAVVHEFILNDTHDRPLFPALFSLNMLVVTENGRAYSQSKISNMFERAGLVDVRRLDFKGPMDSGVIQAVKPG